MNNRIEEELFPFYALDALTAEERAEVEAYIARDPAAKARLNSLQETAELLPLAAEPVMPSPTVKANLMARVQAGQPCPANGRCLHINRCAQICETAVFPAADLVGSL